MIGDTTHTDAFITHFINKWIFIESIMDSTFSHDENLLLFMQTITNIHFPMEESYHYQLFHYMDGAFLC